jgi:hypothetical protein
MHPALLIAVMEERDRELARRSRHAWKRPAPPRREARVGRALARVRLQIRRALPTRRGRRSRQPVTSGS